MTDERDERAARRAARNRVRIALIAVVLVWTFAYNLLIKGRGRSAPSSSWSTRSATTS